MEAESVKHFFDIAIVLNYGKLHFFCIFLLIFWDESGIITYVAEREPKSEDMERYSNGKEPHWKCGVPQGIVRSSRILSAKQKTTEFRWSFSSSSQKPPVFF